MLDCLKIRQASIHYIFSYNSKCGWIACFQKSKYQKKKKGIIISDKRVAEKVQKILLQVKEQAKQKIRYECKQRLY